MDRGDWWATVLGVTKSWIQLSVHMCMHARAHTHTLTVHSLTHHTFVYSVSVTELNPDNRDMMGMCLACHRELRLTDSVQQNRSKKSYFLFVDT